MVDFPQPDASEYLATAIRNASNPLMSKKRTNDQTKHAQRSAISLGHNRIEASIEAKISEFIPPHEIYNDMRKAVLSAVVDEKLFNADPVTDKDRLAQIANGIQAKRPKFRNPGKNETVEAVLVSGLYQQIKSFPASELAGHRWEASRATGDISGQTREAHDPSYRRLSMISDAIMPASPFYNDLRQKLFDVVHEKGATVQNELRRSAEIRVEMLAPDAPEFIPNSFHHHSKEAMREINGLLLPHKKAFEGGIAQPKAVTPEALSQIGKLMVAHHRSWVPLRMPDISGQPVAKIPRLNLRDEATRFPTQVPDAILQASRHFEPDIASTKPGASGLKDRLIEQIDSIYSTVASNFSKRQKLGRMVFSKREQLIEATTAAEGYRKVFGNPDTEKNKITSQHSQTIRDMAEVMERFTAAYEGRQPGFGLEAESSGPSKPVRLLPKARRTGNLNQLEKAGKNVDQLPIGAFLDVRKRSHADMVGEGVHSSSSSSPTSHSVAQPQPSKSSERDNRSQDHERDSSAVR